MLDIDDYALNTDSVRLEAPILRPEKVLCGDELQGPL